MRSAAIVCTIKLCIAIPHTSCEVSHYSITITMAADAGTGEEIEALAIIENLHSWTSCLQGVMDTGFR